jgi:two-component system, sensor histidine kinase and response regulator
MSDAATAGTILVVDDNLQNRQLAEGLLLAAGYQSALAESGARALAMFTERPFDLVLLDIMMPQMDGFETCKRLRELPRGVETPIVFLTALSDLQTHEQALRSGADDFLTKPINRTELVIRVRSLIRIKRLQDELKKNYEVIRKQHESLMRVQRQKDELSALVVHDLKSPLTGILGNAELIMDGNADATMIRACAGDIHECAKSMHRMVVNLLDISRSEDGELKPRAVPVSFAAIMDKLSRTMRRRTEDRRQNLVLAIDPAMPKLLADPELLERVIENLIDNALKYAPPGGSITIEARALEPGRVELRVSDEGPGIPPNQREKIFEKYVQVDKAAEAALARASRGLGLTFCKLAVNAQGGHITVEPRVPKGSTFKIELPAARD